MRGLLRFRLIASLAALLFSGCDRLLPQDQGAASVARRTFALTDTDADGMDDDWEQLHFGGLSRDGTGDFDSDGITDLEEFQHDLDPTIDDGLDDADGDRYPNVFEVRRGSDPNDDEDLPTPNYVVNVAGGGDYATINGAVAAATTANGTYQIIAVQPGTYSGTGNLNFSIASTKPRLLILGVEDSVKILVHNRAS